MTNRFNYEELEYFVYARGRKILNDKSLTLDEIKQKLIAELTVDPQYVDTFILELKSIKEIDGKL